MQIEPRRFCLTLGQNGSRFFSLEMLLADGQILRSNWITDPVSAEYEHLEVARRFRDFAQALEKI